MERSALEDVRVLDFATPVAEATGRVLADLGAEVIKIENPGGCESRLTPPFAKTAEGESSLFWRFWGRGKHSVVADLDSPADRDRLRRLVLSADILIESFCPGTMDALGLGAEALAKRNPSLIYVSVTPFGQSGPYAKHPATDLTLAAAGGLLNMQGDADRPPVPLGFPETAHLGAVQAAADALLALYGRCGSGEGQHLDTSIQAAVLWSLMNVTSYAAFDRNPPGYGEDRRARKGVQIVPGVEVPICEPCKDGYVVMTLTLGSQGTHGFNAAMTWIGEQGGLDADLMDVNWTTWVDQVVKGELAMDKAKRALDQFRAQLKRMTKAEIHELAVAQKWLIAPVNNARDLYNDPQLAARDFWVDVGGSTLPGPFARLSRTPVQYRSPAPRLGADQSLLERLDQVPPQSSKPAVSRSVSAPKLLDRLKVADFSWVAAGPLVAKDLANHGATVVRVETEKRIDTLRQLPPWEGAPSLSSGHPCANMNQSKYGIALDLKTDEGLQVAYRVAEWADVVIENFTPGTAERMGIDYETLRKINPELIMLSTSMRGQSGPEAGYSGFGLQGAALAGFVAPTGWPDRKPSPPWGAYTDFISPRFAISALAAALYHRERTGEGQLVDVSQIEAGIHHLGPMLLDYQQRGRVLDRVGHESERGCPHGVYPSSGTERYIAIEARTADQWRALCTQVAPLAAVDPAGELSSLDRRLERREEIDAALVAWCARRDAFQSAEMLRAAGVPAYAVLRATDLREDPQLSARGFFIELEHMEIRNRVFDGPVTEFSKTPMCPWRAGPTIGEHTMKVMSEMLGYGEDEIHRIAATGALS